MENNEYKWRLAQNTFFLIAFISGSIGNALVIIVIVINRKRRTSINIYLLNLALTDLLVFLFIEVQILDRDFKVVQ